MQWIKYNYVCGYDEEGNEIFIQKKIGYNEANLTIAESEAYNGEYTIEEDSKAYSTEPLEIEFGGTGASNKESALKNLGITATASELNTLDGVTATANELNYVKGATSNIQTQINKKADLGSNGLIPTSQLPSYVDDVLEYASKVNFPTTGATGKIYVDLATNLTYRWSGSAYVEISPSLALGETSSTAYRGDRGKIAYDHSQTPHNYSPSGHSHDAATQSAAGMMSASDKKKLDGIATGANAYTHPAYTARTGVPTANATPGFGGTFSVTQPTSDATGHVTGMNSRTITIPSTVASQSVNGLMTATDKKKLDGIATGANAYSHPTTSGNKHIPSGGSAGQILRWGSDGTAVWGADNNTTYSPATQSTNGLMSASDKAKFDNMMLLLWANSNVTQSFGNSYINLSAALPYFRNFVVVFNEGTSNTYAHSVVVHKSQNFKMQFNEFYNGATINFERAVWIDDGTLAFGHAYYNGVEDNSRVIPNKVYGLI